MVIGKFDEDIFMEKKKQGGTVGATSNRNKEVD